MNLKQIVRNDSHRIKASKKFVLSTLAHMIQKPLYPKGPDDGTDHTQEYLRKLKTKTNLRTRKQENKHAGN